MQGRGILHESLYIYIYICREQVLFRTDIICALVFPCRRSIVLTFFDLSCTRVKCIDLCAGEERRGKEQESVCFFNRLKMVMKRRFDRVKRLINDAGLRI